MENKKRIIIIGGLSAGPSAAAKARRTDENAEIILFEKTANISYATCGIPYAFSGKIKDRDKLLVVKPDLLRKRFNIDVHLEEPVINIDPEKHIIYTPKGEYVYDKLVYATGGTAIVPPLEGLEENENWANAKTIEDFDRIIESKALENADNITIVGAGLIGLETAENLVQIGKKVTVIELGKHILGPWDDKFAHMGEKVLEENSVRLELGKKVDKINADNSLVLNDGTVLVSDFMIMSIGVKPITEMLTSKGAKALPNGALIVNTKMETSLPDIYAAGDCASIPNIVTASEGWFPMGTHSNKGGRVAGANAVGATETFPGGYGTAIMEMFDHTIARTGAGPKMLTKEGIPFESTFIIANSHPGFYPGGKDMFIEIYYTPDTHQILGAELFGEKGVDKRTDVLATAIYAKLTIEDLPNLDLAYAPPFSPAKDPVIVAGFVAQNAQKGLFKEVNVTVAKEAIDNGDVTVLDVRNPQELENAGVISENAINLPLDSLREHLSEIPTDKPIYVTCAKGLRGYLASLILAHNGFNNLHNIAGGFTAWKKINL